MSEGEKSVWIKKDIFVKYLEKTTKHDDIFLTFDDGNISDYEIAFSELVSRNITGKFFIATDFIDKNNYLSKSNIKELVKYGMVIGTHGKAHVSWRGLCERFLDDEILHSKKKLEKIINTEVNIAACPFGQYDSLVLKKLKSYNFKSIYTSDGIPSTMDSLVQPRYSIKNDDDAEIIEKIINQKLMSCDTLLRKVKILLKSIR